VRHAFNRLLAVAILAVPLSSGAGANVVLCTAEDGHSTLEASHPGRACEVEERRHAEPAAASHSGGLRESRDCFDSELSLTIGTQESVGKRIVVAPGVFASPSLLPPPTVAAQFHAPASGIHNGARVLATLRSVVLIL